MAVEGIGVPAPGQTLLMTGALLAGRGELSLPALLVTAFAAAVLGNAAGFEIGRRGGRPLLLRFARPELLARVEGWFRSSDTAVVGLGRFVDGARQLNGLAAGAFGMEPRRFHLCSLLGAVLWTGFWGLGAYFFGRDFDVVARWLHGTRGILLAAAALSSVALLLWLCLRRR